MDHGATPRPGIDDVVDEGGLQWPIPAFNERSGVELIVDSVSLGSVNNLDVVGLFVGVSVTII